MTADLTKWKSTPGQSRQVLQDIVDAAKDADTVDGKHAAEFSLTTHNHDAAYSALGHTHTIANAQLAADVARANLLTNGGFEIWQRGNGPFTTSNVWIADRWQMQFAGPATLSVSKDTANKDARSEACAAATFVGGNWGKIVQPLSDLLPHLKGQTISISVRVKCTTAGGVQLKFEDSTGTTDGTANTGVAGYETLTVTATVGAGATWGNLAVHFLASCTAYIDNAMLVISTVPVDYVPLTPAEEWARCERYLRIIQAVKIGGYLAANAWGMQPIAFSQMATTPAASTSGWASKTGLTAGTPGLEGPSSSVVTLTYQNSGVAGTYYADSGLITLEANP